MMAISSPSPPSKELEAQPVAAQPDPEPSPSPRRRPRPAANLADHRTDAESPTVSPPVETDARIPLQAKSVRRSRL